MTDHKYPNEIASCHTMLKKRDVIIEQLQAEKQPGESEEFNRLHEELGIYKREHAALVSKREDLEHQIYELKEIQKGDEQAKDRLHKIIDDKQQISKAPVKGNMVLLKNQIAEQKRDIQAHMEKIDELMAEVKDCRDFKQALVKVLDNGG